MTGRLDDRDLVAPRVLHHEEQRRARDRLRRRADLQPELNRLSKAGRWEEMPGTIDDTMLGALAAVGSPGAIPPLTTFFIEPITYTPVTGITTRHAVRHCP